jgi:Kef-type K+ transport system membrane component KefB
VSEAVLTQLLLVFGLAVVLAMLVKALLERLRIAPLVGYIGLGLLLQVTAHDLLDETTHLVFGFLAELGVVCLLFRVGLECSLESLLHELPKVIPTWIADVTLSAGLSFVAAHYVLGLELVPSLVAAVALSATSIGIPVLIWEEAGALRTRVGSWLVDVAELDDLSAVGLMILLFAALPVVLNGAPAPSALAHVLGWAGLGLLGKAALFFLGCFLFARYLERPLTALFLRFERPPDPTLAVTGVGMLIAAAAGYLGFSVAVGALFAGLAYSRDPAAVRLEASFDTIYDLFTPFFFIAIGLELSIPALGSSLSWGLVLLTAGALGKLLGAGASAWWALGRRDALLLAVSMVPRAEISLYVVGAVKVMAPWAVPDALYGGMVFVAAVTCLGVPLVLRPLLARWPPEGALPPEPSRVTPEAGSPPTSPG